MKSISPAYRFHLKGKIHESGFTTSREFANSIRLDEAILSKILRGWLYPGVKTQRRLAEGLGVTLKDMRGLL